MTITVYNFKLTQKNFDPVFSKKFFHANVEEKNDKSTDKESCDFDFPPGNTAKEFAVTLSYFIKSEKGEKFKKGVRNILDEISETIQSWSVDKNHKRKRIETLEYFYKKNFADYEGISYLYNEKQFTLLTKGVLSLKKLSHHLKNTNIALSLRQAVISNLLDNDELIRCGPGTAGFLEDACLKLSSDTDQILQAAKHEIIYQVAKTIYLTIIPQDNYTFIGMETHYVRFISYIYSKILGLNELYDPYFHNLNASQTTELLKRCGAQLPKSLILSNIISHLISQFDLTEILKNMKANLIEFKQNTMSMGLLFANYYSSVTQTLETQLNNYGLDADWVVASFFNCELDDNQISVELNPNAYDVLKISLIQRLFISGYLDNTKRHSITLFPNITLSIIHGIANSDLAFVTINTMVKQYIFFDAYYKSLSLDAKKHCITQLLNFYKTNLILQIELITIAEKFESMYLAFLKNNIVAVTYKNNQGLTPMLLAVTKHYKHVLNHLMANYPITLNDILFNGSTVLHLAAEAGYFQLVQFFVNRCKFPIALTNRYNLIPLHYAIHQNHTAISLYLINLHTTDELSIKSNKGVTPFGSAMEARNWQILLALLEKYAPSELEKKWLSEHASLHEALFTKCYQLKLLPNLSNDLILKTCIIKKFHALSIRLLNENKALAELALDPFGNKAIHYAAEKGDLQLIKQLIINYNTANIINSQGHTCFWHAFKNNHDEIIHYLLQHNFKPNDDDKTEIA